MRILLSTLLLPLPFLFLLLLLGAGAYYFRRRRLAQGLWIGAAVWLLLISTAPLPRFLVRQLEQQYPPVNLAAISYPGSTPVYIAILGGGHIRDERLSPTNQLSANALGRTVEGIRIFRQLSNSRLVFSGWSSTGAMSQAMVGAQAAQALGVDDTRIDTLPEPWNTRTEGLAYAGAFGKEARLILVTDAVHMPRSVMHFRNAGLDPVPAPANHLVKEDGRGSLFGWLVPSSGNIARMEKATHEYAGMVWMWMGGD